MTDEGYRCTGCGQENCPGHLEFKYGDQWYTQDMLEKLDIQGQCDDERYICGETDEPAELHIVWSTEDY